MPSKEHVVMARGSSNAQLIHLDHSQLSNGVNDSSGGDGLPAELQLMGGSQKRDVPWFGDNQFPSPTSSQPPTSFQAPRIDVFAPGDSQRDRVNPSSQYANQAAGCLALPGSPPGSASESGQSRRSDWSFHSIVEVYDRGADAHVKWEQSSKTPLPRESPENGTGITTELSVHSVGNQICDSLEVSAFDEKSYLPLDRLSEIFAPEVVRKLLHQHFDESTADKYEAEVLGTGRCSDSPLGPRRRRIFAILVLVEEITRLKEFVDKKIDDSGLPLTFERKKGRTRKVSCAGHELAQPDGSFAEWPSKTAEKFRLYQQTIHVPFFKLPGHEVSFYDLQQDSTLPFSRYESPQSGGYGSVQKVSIHHAHHDSGGHSKRKKSLDCAVKRLHSPNPDAYLKEIEIFDRLGKEKREEGLSDHLISLQLTYKHGRDFFLVFPWADGNLKEFWLRNEASSGNFAHVCWFFGQCWGIARGLRKIHHLGTEPKKRLQETLDANNASKMILAQPRDNKEWGRHGDIKPENILWFKDHHGKENHLVISDFGLTQFNSAHSRSKVLQDQIQGFSGTYRPPDLHLEGKISQRYDVWSLGCVLLEFTSWFLLGYKQGIEDFVEERLNDKLESRTAREDKFFSLIEGAKDKKGKNAAKVKDSVIEWIRKLHRMDHCTKPLHRLLDLIEGAMLAPYSRVRWDCDRIRNELKILYKKCSDNKDIAVKGVRKEPKPCRYLFTDTAGERVENGQTQIQRMSDEEFQDSQANLITEEDSVHKAPPMPAGNTNETLVNTSQGDVSTETPYSTQESTQQQVKSSGAQFDGDLVTKGPCEDASGSSVHLTISRTSIGPSSFAESHRQLLEETLPQAASQGVEPSIRDSRPGTQVSGGTNAMQPTEPRPPDRDGIGERILSWLKKKLCSR